MNDVSFKRRIKDMDKQLLVATIILLIIGTLSIVSASSRETVSHYGYSVYHYFKYAILWIVAGGIGSIVIINVPTKYYKKIGFILWFIIAALLLFLWIRGETKRGSNNWISFKHFSFQPSEFSKPVMIAVLSIIFEVFNKRLKNDNKNDRLLFMGFWVVFGLGFPALVFLAGDLGTALILLGISVIMFISSPLEEEYKYKYSAGLFGLFLVLVVVLFIARGYLLTKEQSSRLDFFNPCSKYEDNGYQVCNALIAMNNGGVNGLGIGKSQQKYSYIPEPHTDSIFAIIVEEKGLLLGLIIIGLYIWMLKRIYTIARESVTIRGRYIAFGAFIYLFLHILFNLGGLLAVLPLTGVPLPLISYGGSSTISFIGMLAMVQLVNIENRNQKIKISK